MAVQSIFQWCDTESSCIKALKVQLRVATCSPSEDQSSTMQELIIFFARHCLFWFVCQGNSSVEYPPRQIYIAWRTFVEFWTSVWHSPERWTWIRTSNCRIGCSQLWRLSAVKLLVSSRRSVSVAPPWMTIWGCLYFSLFLHINWIKWLFANWVCQCCYWPCLF